MNHVFRTLRVSRARRVLVPFESARTPRVCIRGARHSHVKRIRGGVRFHGGFHDTPQGVAEKVSEALSIEKRALGQETPLGLSCRSRD